MEEVREPNKEAAYTVEFQPVGRRVVVAAGTSILEAWQLAGCEREGWGLEASCGGHGKCGQCRVRVLAGAVSGADEEERELLARGGGGAGMRLACRARVRGHVKVELPRLGQEARLQVEGLGIGTAVDPPLGRVPFRLCPPSLSDPRADEARLAGELGFPDLRFDIEVLRTMSPEFRRHGFTGWAYLRDREVIDVTYGDVPPLGLAVDLGTTKIAGYLVHLETGEVLASGALLNPQVRYGEDVISRLAYAMSDEDSFQRLRTAAAEGINVLCEQLCRRAGWEPERVEEAVVCGNTAMHHLFLGLPVSQLGVAPYVPVCAGPVDVKGREVGIRLARGGYVHVMPCIAGFVGGDHVAMLLATRLPEKAGVVLGIDIGTNTEIALVRRGKIMCCSCASGPAFEGSSISRGMRALTGAIDRVWWNRERQETEFSVVGEGEPVGFCGTGLVDLLAVLLDSGAMDGHGRLREGAPGVQRGSDGPSFLLGGVPLTQQDVRQLQLAKAAVRSGIEGLLRATGTAYRDVEQVFLAGAFGTAIDPGSAVRIGMFPPWPLERFHLVGNAAGTGARLALLARRERARAVEIARQASYLELTTSRDYTDVFISSIDFPGCSGPRPVCYNGG